MHIESWFPTPEPSPRRPAGVWVVAGVYGLLYGLLALSPLIDPTEFAKMLAGLSRFEQVLLWVNTGLDLAAVTCLVLLLRVSVPLFGAALAISVLGSLSLYSGRGASGRPSAPDAFELLLGVVLPAATWWYVRRLRERGDLH